MGGPVVLPKIYNGRNKTFFFTSFTGFRYRPSSNNPNLTTLPKRFRQGDFGQLLEGPLTAPDPNTGQPLPVFDAAGRPVMKGAIYDPRQSRTVMGPDGASYVVRDPFPGNIIPRSSFNSVSQNVLPYFPEADSDALFNNFFRTTSSKVDQERFVGKIDQYLGGRHHLAGSIFLGTNLNANNGSLTLLEATQVDQPSLHARLSHNFTQSPTLIHTLSFGFLRDKTTNGPVEPGPGLGALGLSGIELPEGSPFPLIGITNINGLGSRTYDAVAQNRFIGNGSSTWIKGSHTLKFGGELRRLQRNEFPINGGTYSFTPTQTALNGTGSINTASGPVPVTLPVGQTGSAVASFLMGAVDFSRFDLGYTTAGYRWLQAGGYLQDDWKVTRNLTLNLGFRYDVAVPRTEVLGRASTADPHLPNPAAGGVLGAMTFFGEGAGRNGRKRIGDIDWGASQPRLGFAYSPGGGKTVFRGGWALTRPLANDTLANALHSGHHSPGFNGLATVNRPGDDVGSPAFFWDESFPNFEAPPSINPGLLTGNVNPPMIFPESGHPATQINWNFEIQRSLPWSMVASVGYVGTHVYHLGIWRKPNQVNPALAEQYRPAAEAAGLPLNQFLALNIDDPRASSVPKPWPEFSELMGASATVGQALRPFPQYGNIDNLMVPMGSTSYNGLQTRLQKRFSDGLTFLVSYTFSKTIGDVDSIHGAFAGAENNIFGASFQQDYYDNRAERSVTSSDIPHVLAISYTYELPFGPGKRFANKGGALGKLVGGWQVSTIHLYQTGRPIHMHWFVFGADNPYKANDGFSMRPDLVLGEPLINPSFDRKCVGLLPTGAGREPCQYYINPAAFRPPAASSGFGNVPKYLSNLRTFNYYNEDISISKRTTINERFTLQFMANFFNVFNRVVIDSGGNNASLLNGAPSDLSSESLAASLSPFGIPTGQQNGPRRIQFALKLEF